MPGIYCEPPHLGPADLPPGGESPQPQAGALQGQVQPEEAGQEGRQAGLERSAETAAGLA